MAPICAAIGICVAGYLGNWVLKQDPGPDKMNNISIKIQQGAQAFLMAEYKMLAIFVVVVALIMTFALDKVQEGNPVHGARVRDRRRPVRRGWLRGHVRCHARQHPHHACS
jgi:Na+/H+-translocating membrane pyrophosphatase